MNCTQVSPTNTECAPAQTVRSIQYASPSVDIHQSADGFLIEVELPGVSKNGVDLTVEDGKLIIVGHRNRESTEGKSLHREISSLDFRRVFDLDPMIDPSTAQASMEQGLLRIRLQKADAHKPRKVTIE